MLKDEKICPLIMSCLDDRAVVGQAFQPAFSNLAGWKACPTKGKQYC
jgi:hypothetical protein